MSLPRRTKKTLKKLRAKHLGPSLSLSYEKPLKIVRGEGVYLYDENARPYLDCVNNVCHLGHCHPAVVKAAHNQMRMLNTNTRYLHDNIVALAEKLISKLPDPLQVCFFVNSGSEANDLALRLARTHTGQEDIIVVDGAYHGHTAALIDVSPYKFDSAGGKGAPATTHVAEMPDGLRGGARYGDKDPAGYYARAVKKAISKIKKKKRGLAAFISESIMSCGGQIEFPPDYLNQVYAMVREAGGVCIADEVQVGFGRVGSDFWGFETQDVVPDIVTMGKPMGNGHPIAAVVTTPEIAASFNNGMEYFNTFGGNPVSCAVGTAVLDTIEKDALQQHALEVGTYFKDRLMELKNRHQLIGDIRGRGLFLGIEFLRSRRSQSPAAKEAAEIVEKMKRRAILLSTDGPLHNVIKIKPPLAFQLQHADLVVDKLDQILKKMAHGKKKK